MLVSSWMASTYAVSPHHACLFQNPSACIDGNWRSGTRGIGSRAITVDGKAETVKGNNGREKLFGSADSWVLTGFWRRFSLLYNMAFEVRLPVPQSTALRCARASFSVRCGTLLWLGNLIGWRYWSRSSAGADDLVRRLSSHNGTILIVKYQMGIASSFIYNYIYAWINFVFYSVVVKK